VVGLGVADVEIVDGRIVSVGSVPELPLEEVLSVQGRWLAPAFIDSHVHLAYLPALQEMADGGIAAAVDQAAPLSFLTADGGPLKLKRSGPMVTAQLGYPTQSWGVDGYGIECGDLEAVRNAITQLASGGADFIKIPLTDGPNLSPESFAAAVAEAHGKNLKVSAHALSSVQAQQAALGGADLLAHTPTQLLSEEAVTLWAGRAVVSTLRAFGGGPAARENLAALAGAGTKILYGTDFGNTRDAGIDGVELELMAAADFSPEQILASGTTIPAAFWGFESLGSIEVGKDASLLVLTADPLLDSSTLAVPEFVLIRGLRR
jgi:imidazolonepropionase-like amidohydrolase